MARSTVDADRPSEIENQAGSAAASGFFGRVLSDGLVFDILEQTGHKRNGQPPS